MKKSEKKPISKLTIVLVVMLMWISFVILTYKEPTIRTTNICYDMKSLDATLRDIEENCGSTFITKKYGSDEWYIFKANVCDGKKCSHKHIPIEECLG